MPLGKWLTIVIIAFPAISMGGETADYPVAGRVSSTTFGQPIPDGLTYHLLHSVESVQASQQQVASVRKAVALELSRRGYGMQQVRLLDAQLVLVIRLGAAADEPSVDDILAGKLSPDASLPTGIRYVRLEAYDLSRYLTFMQRDGRFATPDAHLQFLLWNTVVESRGEVDHFAGALSSLLRVATANLGTDGVSGVKFTDPA